MGVNNPGGGTPNFPGQTVTAAKLALSSLSADAITLANGAAITNAGNGVITLDNNGAHLAGNFMLCNANAGNEAGAATAGAAVLPANPVGFFQVRDAAGATRKIPYYAN